MNKIMEARAISIGDVTSLLDRNKGSRPRLLVTGRDRTEGQGVLFDDDEYFMNSVWLIHALDRSLSFRARVEELRVRESTYEQLALPGLEAV